MQRLLDRGADPEVPDIWKNQEEKGQFWKIKKKEVWYKYVVVESDDKTHIDR